MGRHDRQARAPRDAAPSLPEPHGIEIRHDDDPVTGGEADPPDDYGVRVDWQSEAVKIEAAEFLVATRIQQDARLRAAQELERLRRGETE